MKQFVFLLEDNPVVLQEVAEALKNIDDAKLEHFTWPWQLSAWLERIKRAYPNFSGVVVADLYSVRYWDLSKKEPCYLKKRPKHPSPNNPNFLKDVALDCICNYLKEFKEKYNLKVIVYSFMFQFLEERGYQGGSREIEKALEDIGVSKDDIIRKTRLEGHEKEQIEQIVKRVLITLDYKSS